MKHDLFTRSQRHMVREKTWSADGAAFQAGRALAHRDACLAEARRTRVERSRSGWVQLARTFNRQYLHYQSIRRLYA